MSLDYGFAGEVNRNNAMNAVADTMNENNMKILAVSLEMGGKKSIELDGKFYAMDRASTQELNAMKLNFEADGTVKVGSEGVKNDVMSLVGLDSRNIVGGAAGLKLSMKEDSTTTPATYTMTLDFTDNNTNKVMSMGVKMDPDGKVLAFAPLKEGTSSPDDFKKVDDQGGLLKSWGITDAEDLQPGDLFLVQQKLQIIKDLISAVHSVGKTQGDVMREVTQKFAQG
jgi:hypothetical protein